MKPEAQAHTIAKVMDWEYLEETGEMVATEDGDIVGYSWPSLDAMHEAEMARIIQLDSSAFYDALQEIMGRDLQRNITGDGTGFSGWIAHASAAQRAEAFLRTLNLWTE